MTELSDELLVAYVDGQLARDQSEAIERVLDSDSVAARRVEALKDAHRHLEVAFEAMLAGQLAEIEDMQEPADAVEERQAAPSGEANEARWFSIVPIICTAIAFLLIGGGGGWVLHD
ncbi:MAG: anti-sigma factor family protein, partial [Methyloligellaceae bacterium]